MEEVGFAALTPFAGIPNLYFGVGPVRWPAPFLSRTEEVECLLYCLP